MESPAPAPGGVYVHFPFCVRRCCYCDFNTSAPPSIPHRRYGDAVMRELAARAHELRAPARSLYFGGGTPSLWEPAQIARVVVGARQLVGLAADAEITLEANPAEVDVSLIDALRGAGINRISLGVQAIRDPLLAAIGRRHDAETALRAVALVSEAGLRSHSIDLMFGLPGQGLDDWLQDLELIARLALPHLSVYALTVVAGTPLSELVRRRQVCLPDDGTQTEMLFEARRVLRAAGYEHYEVSSYARPDHRSVHNSGYWDMTPYLGLGAGAHGFVGGRRYANEGLTARYIDAALETGLPTAEEELLDEPTAAFERVITGLRRLVDGVDLASDWPRYGAIVAAQRDAGLLHANGTRVRLTDEGLRLMDTVLLAFAP